MVCGLAVLVVMGQVELDHVVGGPDLVLNRRKVGIVQKSELGLVLLLLGVVDEQHLHEVVGGVAEFLNVEGEGVELVY